MKVVLLEGLGVSEQVIEQHARKLESMGHTFVAYPKNTDPLVQAEWSVTRMSSCWPICPWPLSCWRKQRT